ncbi:4Fe-4S binding protein [Seleniivibrio sp.]|uniref:DUF362 domain-containing protein n=1 Tax=Seleniivibrio sp. TaxID=2898801 RepID=UPI0025FCFD83|nr:4Fe-4S binding protein [Seleniivibrio sp.]MCD8552422.1 4Fe-4S binding protein [Seleniivibrio sp.]
MSVVITDSCSACGKCMEQCPAEAIVKSAEGYAVDTGKCTGCGLCIDICPAGAILRTAEDIKQPTTKHIRKHHGQKIHYRNGSFLSRLVHRLHL